MHLSISSSSPVDEGMARPAPDLPRSAGDWQYREFYKDWLREEAEQIGVMKTTLESPDIDQPLEERLKELLEARLRHCQEYNNAVDRASKDDILGTMAAPWQNKLEAALFWLGGWRPTMAFQLAYALAGQHAEAELTNLLQGVDVQTMAGLSARQLSSISRLQEETYRTEQALNGRLATLQMSMADQPLVDLARAELSGNHNGASASSSDGGSEHGESASSTGPGSAMEEAVNNKLSELQELLVEANAVRMRTLRHMMDILNPVQGAQYIIAAAELRMAIRHVGETKALREAQHLPGARQ
eukprot:jgi/Mesen1/10614/ME000088S10108